MTIKAGDSLLMAYTLRPSERAVAVGEPDSFGWVEVKQEYLGKALCYKVLASRCTVIEDEGPFSPSLAETLLPNEESRS